MTHLVACPDCNRHLRRTEVRCPFCDADVAEWMRTQPERMLPAAQLGRAALIAFAAASVAGCGGETVGKTGSGGGGGSSSGGVTDSGLADTGGIGVLYGIAPGGFGGVIGSGGASAGGAVGTGGRSGMGGTIGAGGAIAPPYGIAPLPDAGAFACFDLYSGGTPARCCPDPPPDCTGKPDGYPGYSCVPPPSSYCSCQCAGGKWQCAC